MEALRWTGEPHVDNRRAAFYEELKISANQASREPVQDAFYAAAFHAYEAIPAYRQLTDEYLVDESVDYTSYQLNKYFVAHQFLLIKDGPKREEEGYPQNFADPNVWSRYIEKSFSNIDSPQYRELQEALRRPLQTNRTERAKVPAFLTVMHTSRKPGAEKEIPVVCEIGSAANLVSNALVINTVSAAHDRPTSASFTATSVVDKYGNENIWDAMLFDEYVHSHPYLRLVAIERQPPMSYEDNDWIKACTLSPSQLDTYNGSVSHQEDMFDLTAVLKPPIVRTIANDVLNLTDKEMEELEGSVDVAFISHSAPQIRPFKDLVKVLHHILKPDGIAAANEYGEPNINDPQDIYIYPSWYKSPWLCKTLLYQMAEKERGWLPIFEWETARCDRVRWVDPNIATIAPIFANQ